MKKLLRVPVLSIIFGIIFNLISILIGFIINKNSIGLTENLSIIINNINYLIALIFFIIIGLVGLKNSRKTDILKSSIILSIYYGLILIIQETLIANIPLIFYIPTWLNSQVLNFSLLNLKLNMKASVLLAIISPLLYIIFGRRKSIFEYKI